MAAGFTSLPLSSDFSSVFLVSGEVVGFAGEALGSTVGLAGGVIGLAGVTGDGVETGLFSGLFGAVFVVPPLQAPNTAVVTAKTDARMIFLLIVLSSKLTRRGLAPSAS